MIQVSATKWMLMAPNSTILADDIPAYSVYEATVWAKAYVSSHYDWDVNIIPLRKKEKK